MEEFRTYAMRKFGNYTPCDPARNMTYFGYKRKMLARAKGRKLPPRPDPRFIKIENGVLINTIKDTK